MTKITELLWTAFTANWYSLGQCLEIIDIRRDIEAWGKIYGKEQACRILELEAGLRKACRALEPNSNLALELQLLLKEGNLIPTTQCTGCRLGWHSERDPESGCRIHITTHTNGRVNQYMACTRETSEKEKCL